MRDVWARAAAVFFQRGLQRQRRWVLGNGLSLDRAIPDFGVKGGRGRPDLGAPQRYIELQRCVMWGAGSCCTQRRL
jgi:hypothetical protein